MLIDIDHSSSSLPLLPSTLPGLHIDADRSISIEEYRNTSIILDMSIYIMSIKNYRIKSFKIEFDQHRYIHIYIYGIVVVVVVVSVVVLVVIVVTVVVAF